MHKGIFFGHLGRPAQVNYTGNGTAVANFPLGVSAGYGQNQHTLWIDCSLFGQRAQGQLPQYLTKGVGVIVEGDVDLRTFQKKDGSMGAAIALNVRDLSFAGGGQAPAGGQNPAQQGQGNPNAGQNQPPQNQGAPQNQPPQGQPGGGAPPVDDFDDDIPF